MGSYDNTPLWGGAQFAYPEWTEGSMLPSIHTTYDPFLGVHMEPNYSELKQESPTGESDSTLIDTHQRSMSYIPQPHHLPLNSGQMLLPENPSYLQPLAAFHNRHSTPDTGYSSPSSISSDYYGIHQQHGQPAPEYSTMMSPYQHMMATEESLVVDNSVKQEQQDVVVSYPKELQYVVVEDGKPIIHENIQICPPIKYGAPQDMQNYVQPQVNPEPFRFNLSVPQETIKVQHVQQEQVEEIIIPDDQPESSSPTSTTEEPKPRKSSAKRTATMAFVDPENRRSARPSAIAHSNYECDLCGNFFARKCGLTQHKKWIHTTRSNQCEKCGKKFDDLKELAEHMQRHNQEEKPHKCQLCPKQFCHKNDLRRHMFRHGGTAPFVCLICNRGFVRADHLVAHNATHERRRQSAVMKAAKKTDSNPPKKMRMSN